MKGGLKKMDEQKKLPTQKPKDDSCKIKIRNTKNGKDIVFQGHCSKSQLSIASGNVDDSPEDD
jgi:hypothetical protein